MKVGVAKETAPGERRVALVPEALGTLQAAGLEILVDSGAGNGAAIPDMPSEPLVSQRSFSATSRTTSAKPRVTIAR